ncbi:MAG: hypothetical protein PHQ62_00015 [Clostridia bacterium]|nr:hypothetical protein [Clostridia bacterium]
MKNNYENFESNNQEFADKNQHLKSQENTNETNGNTKAFSKCENQNANNHYFRITGYCPEHDFCFIIDSNGMFEKLWQFSAYLISKRLKVLEVSNDEKFIDINITKAEPNPENLILRATANGKPEYITQKQNGTTYKAIKVADKVYVPDEYEL